MKKISNCNILFLPVGGTNTMDTKSALNLVSEIEPEIVIPTYYDSLAEFIKSEGSELKEMDELKISKNEMDSEERQIIVLK